MTCSASPVATDVVVMHAVSPVCPRASCSYRTVISVITVVFYIRVRIICEFHASFAGDGALAALRGAQVPQSSSRVC